MHYTQKLLSNMWRSAAKSIKVKTTGQKQISIHPPKDPKPSTRSWTSTREFFMHPLTWDKNNGYFNLVLGLTFFSFIFLNSCSPCETNSPLKKSPQHAPVVVPGDEK